MLERMKGLLRDEEGQGMAEYALLLAGIAVIVMVAVYALGPIIRNKFNEIGDQLG